MREKGVAAILLRLPSALLTLVFFFVSSAAAESIPGLDPSFPQGLIPKSHFILRAATGDLNGDGLADQILIIANNQEKQSPDIIESWRELRIYLRQKGKNTWKPVLQNDRAVLCRNCGGMMGDPLGDVRIENGTFLIAHSGGSRWRWAYSHRFRLQKGGWALIGETSESYDSMNNESEIKDHNLVTGRYHLDIEKEGKKTRKVGYQKKGLKFLRNFDIYKEMEE